MSNCKICGDKCESPDRTVCGGCVLDSFLPPWYEKAEKYVYDAAYGHANATQHPPTGVQILDVASATRICDTLLTGKSPEHAHRAH